MSKDEPSITIYSDYVCPFCYLGRQSLGAYQQTRDRPLAIEWHPFDLRSQKRGPDGTLDHSVDDGKDAAYFDQVRENVTRLRDAYGAEEMLDIDQVPREIDSFDAQVASMYVDEEYPDRWEDFDAAIFEAHWIDGRDIGERSVLVNLAEDVGLDGEEIGNAIEDQTNREQLREAFAQAREQGISAVPTFVYGSHAARGAVPPEQLQRLVEGT
ncbi:MAG: DsbA family protein [Halobacteriales archaeon]